MQRSDEIRKRNELVLSRPEIIREPQGLEDRELRKSFLDDRLSVSYTLRAVIYSIIAFRTCMSTTRLHDMLSYSIIFYFVHLP